MLEFTKKYQLWEKISSEKQIAFYQFTEFETLQECIVAPKTGAWYITKRVSLNVSDAEEQQGPLSPPFIPAYAGPTIPIESTQVAETTPEEDEALAAYLSGGTGTVA